MAGTRRNPTMEDVAARAGVSHQTVWRVINAPSSVRAETQQRILAVIEELGYRPNQAARRLVLKRSGVVGVLGPATPNFGPQSTVFAVEHALREVGYHPLVVSADPPGVEDALDFMLGQAIEALVVIASHRDVQQSVDKAARDLPVISLQTGSSGERLSVAVDQRHGIRAAFGHLVELGHTNIQYVAGPTEFAEAALRAEEFTRLVRRQRLPELELLSGDWSADSGYDAVARLDARATALMCGNDQMAIGAMHALGDEGRGVPEAVSVVGFDDVPESRHAIPPLTTVRQDFTRVGRRAVEVLVRRLQDGEAVSPRPLRPTLVVRSSTARPRRLR